MTPKNDTIKLKVLKDYPSVEGMLHKGDVVLLDKKFESYANSSEKYIIVTYDNSISEKILIANELNEHNISIKLNQQISCF